MNKEKLYLILKKEYGYITVYKYRGTNIRKISRILGVPYRNIYRYDYMNDVQKWMLLNSDYTDYVCFYNTNNLLCFANKETGKLKPLYFFKELEEIIIDYERSLRQWKNMFT